MIEFIIIHILYLMMSIIDFLYPIFIAIEYNALTIFIFVVAFVLVKIAESMS